MTYLSHIPSPPLNSYIKSLYLPKYPFAPYLREMILPSPLIDVKINFGSDFLIYEADQDKPFTTCAESWCVGIPSRYNIVQWPSDRQFIGVVFRPGGAYPFLRIPISELRDQIVPLDAIWERAAEVRERLYSEPTAQARFALMEHLLLERFAEPPQGFDAVQFAARQIVRHRGALSIQALSDQMGISHKHLITRFKQMVGTTPKEFTRLWRFWHMLENLDLAQPVEWGHLARQHGYYDQSHFNKDFAAFTGHSPGEYLSVRYRIYDENPDHTRHVRALPLG